MHARNPVLDHIKALACLLIVCHHLAFYGPMADVVRPELPTLIGWLDSHARMAVQVFLVLGGYLAAAVLTPAFASPSPSAPPAKPWPMLAKRFQRLALPYSAALMLALLVNELVRGAGYAHASVSATPTWASVLAHLVLLHSLGGYESISAGVWYIAIDFQLYALCLLWLWACSRQRAWRGLGQAGIAVGTALSLWVWNQDSTLDVWAIYFLGAYGLGMLAWWATHSPSRAQRQGWLLLLLALGGSALALAWRDRIALALCCALLLVALPHWHRLRQRLSQASTQPARSSVHPIGTALTWLGQRSYAIFLIHFPVSLLVNASVHLNWPDSLPANALGLLLAVATSVIAGHALHRLTERPPANWARLSGWQLLALCSGGLAISKLI